MRDGRERLRKYGADNALGVLLVIQREGYEAVEARVHAIKDRGERSVVTPLCRRDHIGNRALLSSAPIHK